MHVFNTENIPSMEDFGFYRKTSLARAKRIEGPFKVETSEGPLECQDGYLAVDARGYPYPIATDEFDLIYKETHPDNAIIEFNLEGIKVLTEAIDKIERGAIPTSAHRNALATLRTELNRNLRQAREL